MWVRKAIRHVLIGCAAGLVAACGGGGEIGDGAEAAAADRAQATLLPPADLWQPPTGSTPSSGNYVYLQSDIDDPVGSGQTYLYTPANASISVSGDGDLASISIQGNRVWAGDLQGVRKGRRLTPGYYPNVMRYPFNTASRAGLNWSRDGRSCHRLSGWFAIDSISYSDSGLTTIELRFEQHCGGRTPALRGKIRWQAATPAGPIRPAPTDLWRPAPGTTPASGNYVYLQSDAGDFVGGGGTYTHTPSNSVLNVTAAGGLLQVSINGDQYWSGDFQTMNVVSSLQPGYYGDLRRYPFHNPVKGGLSWIGNGRGCNVLTGWFAIDSVRYENGMLTSIVLRFEQHCEGGTPALRGKIRWRASDSTEPPGPVDPAPTDLWRPAPGTTPAPDNYVYLQSDAGDYVGAGGTYTYTPRDAMLNVTASGGLLQVSVNGDEYWSGEFRTMDTVSSLQPGYYGDLRRYPFHNPVKGGLSWIGNGRGCNVLTGWFAIDSVRYENGMLTSIVLRFEQHCEGMTPALRGKIRWTRGS